MIDKHRAATVAITLAVAFGSGYLVQNGDAVAARFSGTPETAEPVSPKLTRQEIKAAIPPLPDDISVPKLGAKKTMIHTRRLAALDTGFDAPTLSDAQTPTPFDLACKPRLTISPAPSAMINVSLSAPCDGNARITVSHATLSFTDATDGGGKFTISIPAILEDAKVSVRFEGGRVFESATTIPDLDGYSRSAIVWKGNPGLHIHALEFGAAYGDVGDVWAEAARSPDYGFKALGGFLTVLGNPAVLNPELAEVYTFPADRMSNDGVVRLVVEAEVTESTCSQAITGRTIEVGADGETREVALELQMPDCDATGGYLVLNNLLQNMKIASN